jgi:hypothetical protein
MVITDIYNKNTLVGVYARDIIVPEFPAKFRVGLYGEFVPATAGEHEIELAFTVNNRPYVKLVIGLDKTDGGMISALPFPPFEIVIDGPAELVITAVVDKKGRPQEVLRKMIRQGTIPRAPIALLPPSEQSLDVPQDSAEQPE